MWSDGVIPVVWSWWEPYEWLKQRGDEGGSGGGGWTVAFSRADKSKKERVVINVPKWPRVTSRPSPVTALKRGHLHDHPSQRRTHRHHYARSLSLFVCVCAQLCVRVFGLNKDVFNYYERIHTHPWYASIPLVHGICMTYLPVFKYTKPLHLDWMHKCAISQFMDVDIEHWVGGTEGSLTAWGGHMTSIFQQPCPWGQTVRHKCIINWALFHYVHCSFISMSTITRVIPHLLA